MQGAASSQSLLSALTEFSIKAAAAAFHPRAEPPEGTAFTRLTGSLSCSCFYPGIGAALLGFRGSGMGFALPPPRCSSPRHPEQALPLVLLPRERILPG